MAQYRPTPLARAARLERDLKLPGGRKDILQAGGRLPDGQPQAQHRADAGLPRQEGGVKRLATETGAGQWGSALSFACSMFGLECTVYMVKASYEQKPYRKVMMKLFGADVIPSPSNTTKFGRETLRKDAEDHRVAGHSHIRGDRGCAGSMRGRVLAWLGAELGADAPDRHRAGGEGAAQALDVEARPAGRVRRRRDRTSAGLSSRSSRTG